MTTQEFMAIHLPPFTEAQIVERIEQDIEMEASRITCPTCGRTFQPNSLGVVSCECRESYRREA
jgi:Zn finger protein HypA/HybF involved in hydrogenase expression